MTEIQFKHWLKTGVKLTDEMIEDCVLSVDGGFLVPIHFQRVLFWLRAGLSLPLNLVGGYFGDGFTFRSISNSVE